MAPQHLLVVDIETVPDEAHHEGDGFPKPPFHTVVAIGFLHAASTGRVTASAHYLRAHTPAPRPSGIQKRSGHPR